jgi:hypothetical protein
MDLVRAAVCLVAVVGFFTGSRDNLGEPLAPGPRGKSFAGSERELSLHTLTDERNAPGLKSKGKFHLFVGGTFDPFPIVVYAIQAGIEQAKDSHGGYGQGAAG